jgi:hypothetical protein
LQHADRKNLVEQVGYFFAGAAGAPFTFSMSDVG